MGRSFNFFKQHQRKTNNEVNAFYLQTDFIVCLFSLLSSLVQEGNGDEETETLMESERARVEEWIEPLIIKKKEKNERGYKRYFITSVYFSLIY